MEQPQHSSLNNNHLPLTATSLISQSAFTLKTATSVHGQFYVIQRVTVVKRLHCILIILCICVVLSGSLLSLFCSIQWLCKLTAMTAITMMHRPIRIYTICICIIDTFLTDKFHFKAPINQYGLFSKYLNTHSLR